MRRGGAKSFVDDLGWSRGVVLSRAATLLRSIETQPYDSRICSHTDEHTPLSERREKIKIKVFFFANCGHTGGLVPHMGPFSVRQNRYPLGVYYSRVQCPAGLVVIDPAGRPPPTHATPSLLRTQLEIIPYSPSRKSNTPTPPPLLWEKPIPTGGPNVFLPHRQCVGVGVSASPSSLHACLKVMVPR